MMFEELLINTYQFQREGTFHWRKIYAAILAIVEFGVLFRIIYLFEKKFIITKGEKTKPPKLYDEIEVGVWEIL